MRKDLFKLLAITMLVGLTPLSASSPQKISGAGSTSLNSNGTHDGVSFVNQNANESTLIVRRKSIVNKHKNTVGISTNANGLGNINFTGSSGTTKVYGNVGTSSNTMDTITIQGGPKVNFYGNVHAESLVFSNSGAQTKFKGNATFGVGGVAVDALNTLIVAKNKTLNGDISGGGGYLIFNNNSTINGNLDLYTLKFHYDGRALSEGAKINGDLSTSFIDLSGGSIVLNGNVTLTGSKNTIWVIENNSVAVPLQVSGSVDVDGPVTVIYHIPYDHAPRVGAFNIVSASGGGTSGQPVNVIMNDPRYISVGSNLNGNITVTSTKRNTL